jgi:hypothetical protein
LTYFALGRRALFAAVLVFGFAGQIFVTPLHAAGAFAIGKCGAYGQAFDYPVEAAAIAAARKQCAGDCTTVTMKRSCAALSIDMKNPCGPHGYPFGLAFRVRSTKPPGNATNSAARNASSVPGPAMPRADAEG